MNSQTSTYKNPQQHMNMGVNTGVPDNSVILDGGKIQSSMKLGTPSLQDTAQGKVSKILSDVSGALSPKEVTRAKEQALEFQERMELFVQEVERVKLGFGYRYELDGYIYRLFVSDEIFRSIFERILSENEELGKTYAGVIEGFSGDRKKLKKRIMKGYLEDIVYEGMKEGEYSKDEMTGRLECKGKSAKEVKEMVVENVRNGGKGLNLSSNSLNEIFVGKPELLKDMVVEFAKLGGKWLNLGGIGLDKLFADNPKLLKEMVVEFVKSGGKWLMLNWNGLNNIFAGKPELLKDMVVEFAELGGKGLYLGANGLGEIFTGEPELFKDMVVEYAKSGGKMFISNWNLLSEILSSSIEMKGFATKKATVREIIKAARDTYGVTIDLSD